MSDSIAETPEPGSRVPTGVATRVSRRVRRLVAPNPGPFTYTGTCAYIVGEGEAAIIDPGPAIARHVDALLKAIRGERLVAILATHTHRDHSPAARALREATGAPVLGCAPYAPARGRAEGAHGLDASHDRDYAPDRILEDAETLGFAGATLDVVATPGHTANHLCYALREEGALFTGDHVMGWATTVVAPPDGNMADYMASLEKLSGRDDDIYWPAHGEPVRRPRLHVRALQEHRRQREAAILQRLAAGDETIAEIVAQIYAGVDPWLHTAAALNVLAHLEDLCRRGVVAAKDGIKLDGRYEKP
ncbi:MAG TPA: MBL fold metallo-hydrolase [Methylocystis sp.]|nr:MBL fold metallo-hydrolase [Methylocystis sp.]